MALTVDSSSLGLAIAVDRPCFPLGEQGKGISQKNKVSSFAARLGQVLPL